MNSITNPSSTRAGTAAIAAALLLSLVLAPAAAFAKNENGKGKDSDKKEKVEKRERSDDDNRDRRSSSSRNEIEFGDDKGGLRADGKVWCVKAFGHYIAPGWKKKNGELNPGADCRYPFGISKKFKGDNSSTTPDTTAPVTSNLAAKVSGTKVVITWNNDEPTTGTVRYGTSSVASTTTGSATDNSLGKSHSVTIKSLATSTVYYAFVTARDAAGNESAVQTLSFTTGTGPTVSTDVTPPVIGTVHSIVGTSSVMVGWTTNEPATSKLYFATTQPIDFAAATTRVVEDTTLFKNHFLIAGGLAADTIYYFVAESKDGSGNLSRSGTFAMKTPPGPIVADVTPPTISVPTLSAGTSTIGISFATNEPTTAKVFYGTSTPVDMSTTTGAFIANGLLSGNHTLTITNAATGTPYHLVITATDAAGNATTYGPLSTTTLSGM